MWGRKGLIVAGFFGLLLVGAVTLAFWAYGRDPLLSLPPPGHGLKAERTTLAAPDHRHVEHITLHGNTLGNIAFNLSLLGFSQGALAAPSVQDLAAQDSIRVGWTIVACGGAGAENRHHFGGHSPGRRSR